MAIDITIILHLLHERKQCYQDFDKCINAYVALCIRYFMILLWKLSVSMLVPTHEVLLSNQAHRFTRELLRKKENLMPTDASIPSSPIGFEIISHICLIVLIKKRNEI